MQELPLVALPPQQQQLSQSVGYPLLSLSQRGVAHTKNKTYAQGSKPHSVPKGRVKVAAPYLIPLILFLKAYGMQFNFTLGNPPEKLLGNRFIRV